jgi:Protein of unknown function (DUF2946)
MKPSRTLRRWILGWMIVAFLGIQAIESTHHHESAASEEACSVCQVLAHHPLDLALPVAAPVAALIILLFFISPWQPAFRIAKARWASYHSRAPPHRTA